MRVSTVLKFALSVGTVGLILSQSDVSWAAKMTQPPPGACVFEKKVIANGGACSFHCNPTTMWCEQGWCLNGLWTPIVNCYGPFCSPKCGS